LAVERGHGYQEGIAIENRGGSDMRMSKHRGIVSRTSGLLAVAGMVVAVSCLFCSGCVSSFPHPSPVTVAQILDMSAIGFPADEIISRIKASGTVYRLKASQLTELAEKGVPAAVIDYMQQTYIDAVKRDAAYEGWNYWTMSDDYWYGGVPFGWPYDTIYVIREPEPQFRESVQHERLEGREREVREHGRP
jgi:hypothetical protein